MDLTKPNIEAMYGHLASRFDGARVGVLQALPEFQKEQVKAPQSEQPTWTVWIDVFQPYLEASSASSDILIKFYDEDGNVFDSYDYNGLRTTFNFIQFREDLSNRQYSYHALAVETIDVTSIPFVYRLRLDLPACVGYTYEQTTTTGVYTANVDGRNNPVAPIYNTVNSPTGRYYIHNQRPFHIIRNFVTNPITTIDNSPALGVAYNLFAGQSYHTFNSKNQHNLFHDLLSSTFRHHEDISILLYAHSSTRIEGKNYVSCENVFYNDLLGEMYFLIVEYHAHGS